MDYQQPQQPQQDPYQQPQQPYQQPYQQPGYPGGGYPPQPPQGGKGMSITSMVLGICSLVFCWWSYFAIIGLGLGVAALILAIMARKKNPADGFALAGMICGIIGIALAAIFFICSVCVCVQAANSYSNALGWLL